LIVDQPFDVVGFITPDTTSVGNQTSVYPLLD